MSEAHLGPCKTSMIETLTKKITPWTQDADLTDLRCSEDVQGVTPEEMLFFLHIHYNINTYKLFY